MKIEAVDIFYLAMPEVLDIGDGSQDSALVRLRAGPYVGWGECESSPLPTIAALVCPMSASGCKPVQESVLGQTLDAPADIARIGHAVQRNSFDVLQADHTLSGIDVAMWDLLGRRYGEPIWKLLGYERAYPKLPYASVLFGDTAHATYVKAKGIRAQGYRAAKFGWGPYGVGSVQDDADLPAAAARLESLERARATWYEEPFASAALDEYRQLAALCKTTRLAAGEGSHNEFMARHLMDYGGVGYIQIDAGRIGGISPAKRVADYARDRGVTYVNHTFTNHMTWCASVQAFVGLQEYELCEYPTELKPLAWELTDGHVLPGADGYVRLPDAPGVGLSPDPRAIQKYVLDVEIKVKGQTLYKTPQL